MDTGTVGAVGFTFLDTTIVATGLVKPALMVFTYAADAVMNNEKVVYDANALADSYYSAIHVGGDNQYLVTAALYTGTTDAFKILKYNDDNMPLTRSIAFSHAQPGTVWKVISILHK